MTRISNVSNLLLSATAGAVATLALQSTPASAVTFTIPSTTVSATSSTGTPFTVNGNFAANDTISLNAFGTVDLASTSGGYITNAAGLLQASAPSYGLPTGGSITGPSNNAKYGSLLLGNSSLGFFQVFPTSLGTSPTLAINNVTLSSIFGSGFTGLTNNTVLNFKVNDDSLAYGDNARFFTVSGSIDSATAVPEPFTIIGTLVGGTAAVRLRKKLQAVNK